MFSFNFTFDGDDDTAVESSTSNFTVDANQTISVAAAQSIVIPEKVQQSSEYFPLDKPKTNSSSLSSLIQISDVVSGVYEGGFKKWECSDDLVGYLRRLIEDDEEDKIKETKNPSTEDVSPFELSDIRGSRVIDLGCGQGIPGVYALHQRAGTVVFQDLNEDVLASVTAPNVVGAIGLTSVIRKDNALFSPPASVATAKTRSSGDESSTTTKLESNNATHNENEAPEEKNKEISSQLQEVRTLLEKSARNQLDGKKHIRAPKEKQMSLQERAQYEFLKAEVLRMTESGEDIDEDLLYFIAMAEAEMNGEDSDDEEDSEAVEIVGEVGGDDEYEDEIIVLTDETDDENDDEKKDKTVKKPTTKQNESISTKQDVSTKKTNQNIVETVSECHVPKSHAQFIAGPWASQELTDLLLSANPAFTEQTNITATLKKEMYNSVFKASQNSHFALELITCVENDCYTDELSQVAALLAKVNVNADVTVDSIRKMFNSPHKALIIAKTSTISSSIPKEQIENLMKTIDSTSHICSELTKVSVSSDTSVNIPNEVVAAVFFSNTPNVVSVEWAVSKDSISAILDASVSKDDDATKNQSVFQSAAALSKIYEQLESVVQLLHISSETRKNIINITCHMKNYQFYYLLGFSETGWSTYRSTESDSDVRYIKMIKFVGESTIDAQVQDKKSPKDIGKHPLNSNSRYDLILSAETIYSIDTISILIKSIRNILHINGSALIAAKRYYFGVGGSTAEFIRQVNQYGDMKCAPVRIYQDGSSNIREIVLVQWNDQTKTTFM